MQEIKRRKVFGLGVRARLPLVVRYVSLAALAGVIVYVIVGYRRAPGLREFVMRGGAPELARTVEREVYNFERRFSEGERLRVLLRANKEITYTDGHHELEGVYLEAYPAAGEARPDRIASQRAVYDLDKGTFSFTGAVQIRTRDALSLETDEAVYHQREERAESPAALTFRRENVAGRADSASLDVKGKHLTLRGAVEITIEPGATGGGKQLANVEKPVTLRAPQADFDQTAMSLAFTGGASAEQAPDLMRGDRLAATLASDKKLRRIEARGNSYLRSLTPGRAAEISAADMDFYFDNAQRFERASASGNVSARTLDADAEMTLRDAERAEVMFDTQTDRSLLREMRAGGRPVVTLAAPKSHASDPNAANKRLTADDVKLIWRATGRDLERAVAVGAAELFVEPVAQTPTAERKTLVAPRFYGAFFETGNLAREFKATGGARATFDPVQPSDKHLSRTLAASEITALFRRDTQDVERADAAGDAKFNEGARNGQAATMSYTTGDGTVRLRGGKPTVWDDGARISAREIDSDTRSRTTYARGGAQTAYYSQQQTGGAAPFAKVNSPVFITADAAEFGHDTGVGTYTGDARLWQDDNFVRADRLTLRRDERRMDGEGAVQSALYQARRKDANGAAQTVPVFATSRRISYSEPERLLAYAGDVDIKQGTERITSDRANVYLNQNSAGANQVERTIAEGSVVVTQPGKRATGAWAQYTAADETVILTGDPARVEDAAQGTNESRRLVVYLRENRVTGDDPRGQQGTGRVRSTHRIRRDVKQ